MIYTPAPYSGAEVLVCSWDNYVGKWALTAHLGIAIPPLSARYNAPMPSLFCSTEHSVRSTASTPVYRHEQGALPILVNFSRMNQNRQKFVCVRILQAKLKRRVNIQCQIFFRNSVEIQPGRFQLAEGYSVVVNSTTCRGHKKKSWCGTISDVDRTLT